MDTDRRQHERMPSRLPIWVTDGESGLRRQGQAVNISAGGVYLLVVAETALLTGNNVEVTIGTRCGHGGFDLHRCQPNAEVVRTEEVGYATGLALKFAGQFQRMSPQHQMMPC